MSISIRSSHLLSQQTLEPSHAETESQSTATSAAFASNHLDAVALNPQPLPPKASVLDALRSRFDAVALNPQPLPPKETILGALRSRFDAVALNPQPLPPRESLFDVLRSRFDAVALNPQPLPPKEPEPLANEPRLNVVARLLRGQS